MNHVGEKIVQQAYGGIHFSEDDARNFKKDMKLAQSIGMDVNSEEFEQKMAEFEPKCRAPSPIAP